MHTDEAVNAYIVGQLLAGNAFNYDAQDRHGPALAMLALPLARLQGAKTFSDLTEPELRLTTVLAGTLTILLFGAAVEMFGLVPCLIAALLFAGTSLPVYYNRYFIHESLFVAATFGLILTGWRACEKNSAWQASLAAGCAALMLACKETAVLHFVALAAALFLCRFGSPGRKSLSGLWPWKTALAAAAAFLLVNVLLFTWFGQRWMALTGLMHAVPDLLARAAGEGHEKPFRYYPRLLTGGWSGGVICALACIGFSLALRRSASAPYRFLALYALFIISLYSFIPYKTPWLALNFWLPIALFAGLAIMSLWCLPAKYPALRAALPALSIRAIVAAGVLTAVVLIAVDTRERAFVHPFEESNPYSYAHTSDDLLGLPGEIEELEHQDAVANPRIAVIASDPWPLPWYLRKFTETGFWQPGEQVGAANFYITSTEAAGQYEDQLKDFRPEFFGVRPGVLIILWSPAPK
jgi:uncharacterized protein (TIGR03663 family)